MHNIENNLSLTHHNAKWGNGESNIYWHTDSHVISPPAMHRGLNALMIAFCLPAGSYLIQPCIKLDCYVYTQICYMMKEIIYWIQSNLSISNLMGAEKKFKIYRFYKNRQKKKKFFTLNTKGWIFTIVSFNYILCGK